MKKIILAAALLMLWLSAAAEAAVFAQGSGAACLDGQYFIAVDEGEGHALVRIDGSGAPHISIRADEIGDMTVMDGTLFYLMRSGDTWHIMGLSGDRAYTVYSFADGVRAEQLGSRDGKLFLLLDSRLHMIYPRQGVCAKLAGAAMEEFALHGDHAYYISLDSAAAHSLADTSGSAAHAAAGRLCRVNISTGKVELLVDEGAADLKYAEGMLYFHSFADRYLMGSGADMSLRGRLCMLDCETGSMARLTEDYDWDYAPAAGDVFLLRQDGIFRLSDMSTAYLPSQGAMIEGAQDALVCYEPETAVFTIIR